MSEKNLGGRPPFYDNVEDLEIAIEKYFKENTGIEYDEEGNIVDVKAPTVSGLALFLGFADRQSIYNYRDREEFSNTIRKSITRIEQFAEQQLFKAKSPTGAIFWLKNHGWYDKKEVELNATVDDITSLPPEERDKRIKELLNKRNG